MSQYHPVRFVDVRLEGEKLTRTVYDALIGHVPLDQVILRAIQFAHLDVAPTTPDLAGAEVELIDRENREQAMRDAIAPIRDRYDYILIDCPPSLGLLTINMLSAADSVLIPVQCEYYALEGLSQLLNTVHRIQQSVNSALAIDGVLLTMYDARLNLSRQVVTDAREYFGPKVFETIVPRNVRLAEAPSFGKPIVLYDIASVGAQAYLSVAREVVQRHGAGSRRSAEQQPLEHGPQEDSREERTPAERTPEERTPEDRIPDVHASEEHVARDIAVEPSLSTHPATDPSTDEGIPAAPETTLDVPLQTPADGQRPEPH